MGDLKIAVEVANHRFARRRFRDAPVGLHAGDPQWVPRLADDASRVDPKRDPWFSDREGQAAYLLARVAGTMTPVGRCSAHFIEGEPDGYFGLLDTVDDEEVGAAAVAALLRWARRLLKEHDCTTLTGPASYRLDQEAGVGGGPEVTGRPASPAWLGPALEAAGMEVDRDVPSWRLEPTFGPQPLTEARGLLKRLPKRVRAYADPRLLLAAPGVGRAIALPDLVGPTRADGRLSLARRAARKDWDTAVVVELDGDPSVLVPALSAAAATAGYAALVAPWSPDPHAAPEAVHRLYRCGL